VTTPVTPVPAEPTQILGTNSPDMITTQDGAQAIHGRDGNDVIKAGTGNDVIHGDGGSDRLTGGPCQDVFVFDTRPNTWTNRDKILDLNPADDQIALDNSVYTALTNGALAPDAFRLGSRALDADDRIIYNQSTGILSYDADGNGGGAAVQIAVLAGRPEVTASDLHIL
jgi:Ca2+-binding RTX toxin-like protein